MQQKNQLRKKYFYLRKKKYHDIDKAIFIPFLKLIRSRLKKNFIKIALYYPSNFELNVLKLLNLKYFAQDILLPVINKNNFMNFFLGGETKYYL